MTDFDSANNQKYRQTKKASFSVKLQNNQGDRFIPHKLKTFVQNLALSPEEQYVNQKGKELLQKRDNEETRVLNNRRGALRSSMSDTQETPPEGTSNQNQVSQNRPLRNSTPDIHESPPEGTRNSTQFSQNIQTTAPPDIIDDQVERVIDSISTGANLVQHLTNPKNVTVNALLNYPCNPLIQVDIHAQTNLDLKNKLGTLTVSCHPDSLQHIATPQVFVAVGRALHLQKVFSNFKTSSLKLTPFVSFSTNGYKTFGIITNSLNDPEKCADDLTYFNKNNQSNNNMTFKESSTSNILEDDTTTLKSSDLKQKSSLGLNKCDDLILNESPGENKNTSAIPQFSPFLNSVTVNLVVKNCIQAASNNLKKKKLEYVCLGAILITVRIVALRIRKNYNLQNKQNANKNVTAGNLKIINFFLDQSTIYSSLAIAFFCFPLASVILESFSSVFLLFLRIISTAFPKDFAVVFFRFLSYIPLFYTVFEIVYFQFTLVISFYLRRIVINLVEFFINFIVERICLVFAIIKNAIIQNLTTTTTKSVKD